MDDERQQYQLVLLRIQVSLLTGFLVEGLVQLFRLDHCFKSIHDRHDDIEHQHAYRLKNFALRACLDKIQD